MFSNTYRLSIQYIAYAMVFLMFGISFGNAGLTNAYYSDTETSGINVFEAAELDFLLANITNNFGGITPNNETTPFDVGISTTTNSLPFNYNIRTASTTGVLCEVLTLQAFLEGLPVGSQTLSSFFMSTTSFPTQGDAWEFVVTLGEADSAYSATNCTFDVVFSGWQIDTEYGEGKAYHDDERLTFMVTAGTWEDGPEEEQGIQDIAAIKDAHVSEQKPNDNYGNANTLNVVRQSGKDSEVFIGFDYTLPAGSDVISASLKTYLFTTPTANTNYQASRALSSWSEGGITWNTKPATAPTDTISTGNTSPKWLSFDVTSDVEDYVESAGTNYGWKIADIDPLPTGSRSGQLLSSEQQSQEEARPVLEVVFDAPVATTNHMVINEVFYDVDSNHGSDANNEWVELYNPTPNPISIENWDICDNSSCDNIGVATSVPAYGFALITNDSSTYESEWTLPNGVVVIALNQHIGNGLADGGDRLILKNAADVVVDQVSYGSDVSVFNPAVAITGLDGKSIARVVKGWDTDTVNDWIFNATPNPGTNPGSDEVEVLRFTNAGVEIASISDGLETLPELTQADIDLLLATESLLSEEALPAEVSPLLEEEMKEEPFFDFAGDTVTDNQSDDGEAAGEVKTDEVLEEGVPEPLETLQEESTVEESETTDTSHVEEDEVVLSDEAKQEEVLITDTPVEETPQEEPEEEPETVPSEETAGEEQPQQGEVTPSAEPAA